MIKRFATVNLLQIIRIRRHGEPMSKSGEGSRLEALLRPRILLREWHVSRGNEGIANQSSAETYGFVAESPSETESRRKVEPQPHLRL